MSAIASFGIEKPRLQRLMSLGVGLALFGASLAALVAADLGLDPWNVFHHGLATTTGLSLGVIVTVVSALVLLAWIPLRQRIGVGTIANALVVGLVFELAIGLMPDFASVRARAGLLAIAIVANALATALYVGAGLGPGPRDGLMTGLAAGGRSLRLVRTTIEVGVLIAGWTLGGSVGVGTAVYAVSIGPLIQFFFRPVTNHFERTPKESPCQFQPTS